MGIYLNPGAGKFRMALNSEIYVDKSEIISKLNRMVNTEHRFVCVSRPRRFGKSLTANMISAYYGHTVDGVQIFQDLKIYKQKDFSLYQGKYDVLKISIQDFLSESDSVDEMLSRLQRRIGRDVKRVYKDVDYFDLTHLTDTLEDIYAETGRQFVIILDEWDCLFREYPHDNASQKLYLDFLRNLLKDKEYVALAYMTGILPIKKYGTHSALNMFTEFSMEHPNELASFVGFTEEETNALCQQYQMDFAECQAWYDGYSFPQCEHIYSPKSVVDAMMHHRFGSYWNKTETYEALQVYIDLNEDGLRDAIVKMMGGGRQKIDTGTFQNDMTTFTSADDVMTLLVHLGYLGYDIENEEVFIPNNEVMREYVNATKKGKEWEIVSHSSNSSKKL